MAEWIEITDEGTEERVANVDLRKDRKLEKPVHFVCVEHQNHAFNLGAINHRDRMGRMQNTGRRGRTCRFRNGHFEARTKAELDYCRSKRFIYEEPTEGYLFRHPKGFSTRNEDCWHAFLAKRES